MESPESYITVSTRHLRLISAPCISRDFLKVKCANVFCCHFYSVKDLRPKFGVLGTRASNPEKLGFRALSHKRTGLRPLRQTFKELRAAQRWDSRIHGINLRTLIRQ